MNKIKQLMRQKFSHKISCRKIAQNLNLSTTTVSSYIERARCAGIRSWTEVEHLSDTDLYNKLFPAQTGTCHRKKSDQIDWDKVHNEYFGFI